MSYRPICDVWILARSKTKYYGAFPAGFLHRAMAVLGVDDESRVLHVCSGRVKDYPFRGYGLNHRTLDIDPALNPDYLQDARDPFPPADEDGWGWDAILIDRPYTAEDAAHYAGGAETLPDLNDLLKRALQAVKPGGRVGVIDYLWPHPGKYGKEVAVIAVGTGRNNRARWYTVFQRLEV